MLAEVCGCNVGSVCASGECSFEGRLQLQAAVAGCVALQLRCSGSCCSGSGSCVVVVDADAVALPQVALRCGCYCIADAIALQLLSIKYHTAV